MLFKYGRNRQNSERIKKKGNAGPLFSLQGKCIHYLMYSHYGPNFNSKKNLIAVKVQNKCLDIFSIMG